MQTTLPGFFPGHSALFQNTRVSTNEEGARRVFSDVHFDLTMMEHTSDIWARNILDSYQSDPVVLKLLQKYLDLEESVGGVEQTPTQPTPTTDSTTVTPRLRVWKKFFP